MHFPRGNINCCWLVITIALLLEFGQICGSTSTLYCFQCSNLVGFNGCPDSSKDIKVWKDLPGKYTEVGVSTSFSCVLGFDASMKLWHQVMSIDSCNRWLLIDLHIRLAYRKNNASPRGSRILLSSGLMLRPQVAMSHAVPRLDATGIRRPRRRTSPMTKSWPLTRTLALSPRWQP